MGYLRAPKWSPDKLLNLSCIPLEDFSDSSNLGNPVCGYLFHFQSPLLNPLQFPEPEGYPAVPTPFFMELSK